MLARPRPPAQVRRASKESSKFSFPSSGDNTSLPELLNRADGLIRERERELSFTSELSRELKQTHEAFVARTPLTSPLQSPQGHSRSISTISTLSNTSTLYQSLHALHSSQSQTISPNSSFDGFGSSASPARTVRHIRRISITQSELNRLSDQNAELLQKLEQLEEESSLADKAGKKRLGKLEREIQTLRDELDEARQDRIQAESSPTIPDFDASGSITSLSHSQNSNTSSSAYDTGNSSESFTTIFHHLLSKISELEEANVQICRDQRDTADRLRDAQSQVEGMRQLWTSLGIHSGSSNEDEEEGIDVEIVADYLENLSSEAEDGKGTVRSLRSVKLNFEGGINGEMHSTLRVPSNMNISHNSQPSTKGRTRGRKSVVGLFAEAGSEGIGLGDISSDSLNLDVTASPLTLNNPRLFSGDELSELDLSVSLVRSRSQSFEADAFNSDDDETGSLGGLDTFRRRTLGSEIGDFGDGDYTPNPFLGSYLRSRNNSLFQELEASELSRRSVSPVEVKDDLEDTGDTQRYRITFPTSTASIHITPPTPDSKNSSSESSSSSSDKSTTSVTTVYSATKSKSKRKTDPESIRARRVSLSQSVRARTGRWGPRLDDIFQVAQFAPVANDDDQDNNDAESHNGRSGIREGIYTRLAGDHTKQAQAKLSISSLGSQETERHQRPGSAENRPPSITFESSRSKSSSASVSSPNLLSSSALKSIAIRPTPSSSRLQRIRSLVLEAWLWLQLLVVLSVFVWAVARKGPRGVLDLKVSEDHGGKEDQAPRDEHVEDKEGLIEDAE